MFIVIVLIWFYHCTRNNFIIKRNILRSGACNPTEQRIASAHFQRKKKKIYCGKIGTNLISIYNWIQNRLGPRRSLWLWNSGADVLLGWRAGQKRPWHLEAWAELLGRRKTCRTWMSPQRYDISNTTVNGGGGGEGRGIWVSPGKWSHQNRSASLYL